MRISEPLTMITDYVLALFCLYFSLRLVQVVRVRQQTSVRLWALGFLTAAFAAIAGGTFHGFAFYLTSAVRGTLWNLTVFLLGTCCAFMVSGTLAASFGRWSRPAKWFYSGLAVSMIGLAVQQSRVEFWPHFTHNDAYHCIQIAALCLFYQGARLLKDKSRAATPSTSIR